MTANFDLRLIVSGGSDQGLGHVARCATLAQEATTRGLRVAISLRGDDAARKLLASELPGIPIAAWSSDEGPQHDATWYVFDTRHSIDTELEALGSQSLIVDRSDHSEHAALTVLPVLHAAPESNPRVLQGGEYCILAPCVRNAPIQPYPGQRSILLITLGGSDPNGFTLPVAEALVRAREAWSDAPGTIEAHAVVGPSFPDAEGTAARLAELDFTVHRDLDRSGMVQLMRQSLLAVAGFGTTLYDLAYLGVPSLYVVHHEGDLQAAARLEALGIGQLAGGNPLDGDALRDRLQRSLRDLLWRTRCSETGRRAIGDGNGAKRIVDLMFGAEAA